MKFFLLITLVSIYLRGAKSADTDTCSLLQSNMNKTETMMTKTNDLLERSIELLEGIKKQGEDKTFDNLTQVQSQIAQQIGEASGGAVHLVTDGEVKYPQEALGFFSLKSNYNKKEAPSRSSVQGWLRPTFVMDIDSMKQRMGLEIYFVLMWQEDSSRVKWALEDQMTNGSAFSFSPSILE